MKKITGVFVLFLVAAAAFAAGGTEGTSTDTGYTLTAPGAFPVVNGPAEITIMVGRDDNRTNDMDNNEFTKWYEEKSGVHIDWIQVAGAQVGEKTNVALASGDYPEAFMSADINKVQLAIYGSQGIFAPLNDSIEKQSVYLKKTAGMTPYLLKDMTAPEGNIYAFPGAAECYHCTAQRKFYIYEPWLDALGMEPPETSDQLYEMLKAFKTNDLNGNGKADEIPFVTRSHEYYPFFMNAFVYTGGSNPPHLMLNNGKVETPMTTPEWREGLRYMNRLYEEGLLSPESFTITSSTQLKQIGENPGIVIAGSSCTSWFGNFVQNNGESGRWKDYIGIAPVEGPNGLRIASTWPFDADPKLVVTDKANDVDLITRWVDWLYTVEGTLSSHQGVEGLSWERLTDGPILSHAEWKGLTGYEVDNLGWGSSAPGYMSYKVREDAEKQIPTTDPNIMYGAGYLNYQHVLQLLEPYKKKDVLPKLFFTEDQARDLAEIETIMKDVGRQSIVRFVSGDLDVDDDGDWNNYLAEFEKIGLSKLIEIYQSAYAAVY